MEEVPTDEYYLTPKTFNKYVVKVINALEEMDYKKDAFSVLKGVYSGMIASYYTGNIRFATRSKSFPTAMEIWEGDTETKWNGSTVIVKQYKVTQEFHEKHIEPNKGKDLDEWNDEDRIAAIMDFYSYLSTGQLFGAENSISIVPAYFQCEILVQKVMDVLIGNRKIRTVKIFDPTSGWGDRFVAVYLLSILFPSIEFRYLGIDLNAKLEKPYEHIMEDLVQDNFEGRLLIGDTLEKSPSLMEEFFKYDDNIHNMIFTSPPFFDAEDTMYIEAESYEVWRSAWFEPFLRMFIPFIERGAELSLHVPVSKDKPMKREVEEMFSEYSRSIMREASSPVDKVVVLSVRRT